VDEACTGPKALSDFDISRNGLSSVPRQSEAITWGTRFNEEKKVMYHSRPYCDVVGHWYHQLAGVYDAALGR